MSHGFVIYARGAGQRAEGGVCFLVIFVARELVSLGMENQLGEQVCWMSIVGNNQVEKEPELFTGRITPRGSGRVG